MKKNVLVIEDDENIARAHEMILSEDFNVHVAEDGEKGLAKAKEIKPDLVILDLMLPKIHGIDVCKSIKSDEGMKNTKVVMVTAKDQPKDELKGMDTGADDYIMKPFEADELKHVINQVLEK
ncbi:response regulator [Candidatus Woesearchaeota archaeon]|nr:response regulator [Candidatus Woesearchaeota archaeon]